MTQDTHDSELPLEARLNLQTARISWTELERSFARGRVLYVAEDIDLIEVAQALVEDKVAAFNQWTQADQVLPLPDTVARQWYSDDHDLWAVVVAPWVLVQQRKYS